MRRYGIALLTAALFFIIAVEQPESANRFKDNKNGTLTDIVSGLMWVKAPDSEAVIVWQEAVSYSKKSEIGGFKDWRLPTKEELEGIAKPGGKNPSEWLNVQGFEGIQWGFYWTSTIQGEKVWYVDLGTGESGAHPKTRQYYVLLVR
jgi:hypothetical protein